MKRIAVGLLLAAAALSLSQCDEWLFGKEIEYSAGGTATGESESLTVLYNAESGELSEVEDASPWSQIFHVGENDYPFLAFLHVVNDGTQAVDVSILVDEEIVASGVAAAGGGTADCYALVTE
jgi:hypothetical protein